MNKTISPKGRRGIPDQLVNFGRHLVYSEGTKTEPFYVDDIKNCIAEKYKVKANDIELINANKKGKSLSTIGLANFAINDVKARLTNGEVIDHVWIFYDKDNFKIDSFKNAFSKINSLNTKINPENIPCDDNGIAWHSLPSNQCFELLLLLYFDYHTSALDRNGYSDMIDKRVQKIDKTFSYSKNYINIHSKILQSGGTIKNAIKFGKRLDKENELANPSTKAYQFLEYFNPYLEK